MPCLLAFFYEAITVSAITIYVSISTLSTPWAPHQCPLPSLDRRVGRRGSRSCCFLAKGKEYMLLKRIRMA